MSISLIVTAYNSCSHLEKFFLWLDQAHGYFHQIIIVDDCSYDGSLSMLKEKCLEIDKILLIERTRNSGRPSEPRNQAIEQVSSDRIVFMDIDDYVPLSYIKFLANNKESDCFSGVKYRISKTETNFFRACDFSKKNKINDKFFKYKNLISFSGSSLPTDLAKGVKFENKPLEDWIYWQKIKEKNKSLRFIVMNDVPIYYNSSPSLSPKKINQIQRVAQHIGYLRLPVYLMCVLTLYISQMRLSLRIHLNS